MSFDYYEPASLDEAIDILHRGNGGYKPVAGGTDVLIHLRRRAASYRALVNIKRLPDITSWSIESGKGMHIGAATPFRELETSPLVQERFPALVEAIRVIGSLELRNTATIGGNLCNASPSADSAPPLMVAGATVTFVNDGAGPLTCPLEQFFAGPGSSILGPTGILLWVDVPEPEDMTGSCFQRLTPRSAMDIAIASAASRVTLDPDTGKVRDAAIALGAVAPTPVRAPKAEASLIGSEPTPESLGLAGSAAMEECSPIGDIRGSADFRRSMIGVLVRRSLDVAVGRAKGIPGA